MHKDISGVYTPLTPAYVVGQLSGAREAGERDPTSARWMVLVDEHVQSGRWKASSLSISTKTPSGPRWMMPFFCVNVCPARLHVTPVGKRDGPGLA